MKLRFTPYLETLESRLAPAAGLPWLNASTLTLSFAPDGTDILGTPSSLHALLNGNGAGWTREVLRAFQTWAVNAPINFGLVEDGGLPFGTPGLPQGDPRFGDIRIGALLQSAEVLAVTGSPDLFAGTWAGDIFLNAEEQFALNGPEIDLYSVFLHEVGHALGLDHRDNPQSVMSSQYAGVRQGLSPDDIAALQAVYGVRTPDAFEGSSGNDSLDRAVNLAFTKSETTDTSLLKAVGDITTLDDVDYFVIHPTGNTESITISLHTAGVSLLQARISLLDAEGNELGAMENDGSFRDNPTFILTNPSPGIPIYVRMQSAATDVFGVGSYELHVELQTKNEKPDKPGKGTNEDNGAGPPDSDRIVQLPASGGKADRTVYQTSGTLTQELTADWYRVKAPNQSGPAEPKHMVIVLRADTWPAWQPRVNVYDRDGQPIAVETLIYGDGLAAIQLRNVASNADYLIEVESAVAPGEEPLDYSLRIDFQSEPVELETIAEGELGIHADAVTSELVLKENRLLYFLASVGEAAGSTLQVSVLTATGDTVGTFGVDAGGHLSNNLFLHAGVYSLRFELTGTANSSVQTVPFILRGRTITDPIGPRREDLLIDSVFPNLPDPAPGNTPNSVPPPVTDGSAPPLSPRPSLHVPVTPRSALALDDSIIAPFGGSVQAVTAAAFGAATTSAQPSPLDAVSFNRPFVIPTREAIVFAVNVLTPSTIVLDGSILPAVLSYGTGQNGSNTGQGRSELIRTNIQLSGEIGYETSGTSIQQSSRGANESGSQQSSPAGDSSTVPPVAESGGSESTPAGTSTTESHQSAGAAAQTDSQQNTLSTPTTEASYSSDASQGGQQLATSTVVIVGVAAVVSAFLFQPIRTTIRRIAAPALGKKAH